MDRSLSNYGDCTFLLICPGYTGFFHLNLGPTLFYWKLPSVSPRLSERSTYCVPLTDLKFTSGTVTRGGRVLT